MNGKVLQSTKHLLGQLYPLTWVLCIFSSVFGYAKKSMAEPEEDIFVFYSITPRATENPIEEWIVPR